MHLHWTTLYIHAFDETFAHIYSCTCACMPCYRACTINIVNQILLFVSLRFIKFEIHNCIEIKYRYWLEAQTVKRQKKYDILQNDFGLKFRDNYTNVSLCPSVSSGSSKVCVVGERGVRRSTDMVLLPSECDEKEDVSWVCR